jgi:hypothetical protein
MSQYFDVDKLSDAYYTKDTVYGCVWELYVGDGFALRLQHIICNMHYWKGIREKAEEVNSTEAYMTKDNTSR